MQNPEIVATLVHGTFASGAQWCVPSSPFRQALNSEFKERILCSVFSWTGKNSHSARLAAGEELRAHPTLLIAEHPEAAHFVIAHSHGGNVAAYALRDESLQQRIRGVVCVATPYLRCRPRDLSKTLSLSFLVLIPVSAAVAAIGAGLLAIVCTVILSMLFGGASSLPEEVWWIAVLAYVALWGVLTWRINQRLANRIESRFEPALLARQQATLDRYDPAFLHTPRILSVSTALDEAGLHLRLLRLLASVPFVLWPPAMAILLCLCGVLEIFLMLSLLLYVLPKMIPELATLRVDASLGLASIVGNLSGTVIALVAPVFLFALLATLWHLLMFITPKIVRSPFYGFGGETFWDNVLLDIQTCDEPFAANVEHLRRMVSRVHFGKAHKRWLFLRLAHSAVYDDQHVVHEIVAWMGSLSGAPSVVSRAPQARARSATNPLGL